MFFITSQDINKKSQKEKPQPFTCRNQHLLVIYTINFRETVCTTKNNKNLIRYIKYVCGKKKLNEDINIACWHSNLSLDFLKNGECVKLRLYDVNLSHLREDLLHLHFLWLYLIGCCFLF